MCIQFHMCFTIFSWNKKHFVKLKALQLHFFLCLQLAFECIPWKVTNRRSPLRSECQSAVTETTHMHTQTRTDAEMETHSEPDLILVLLSVREFYHWAIPPHCILYTLLSQWEFLPWEIWVAFPKESQLQQIKTHEVKKERFLIWLGKTMCTFSANFAFDKEQMDKHKTRNVVNT